MEKGEWILRNPKTLTTLNLSDKSRTCLLQTPSSPAESRKASFPSSPCSSLPTYSLSGESETGQGSASCACPSTNRTFFLELGLVLHVQVPPLQFWGLSEGRLSIFCFLLTVPRGTRLMAQREESLPYSRRLATAAGNRVYYISLICAKGKGPWWTGTFCSPGILSVQSTSHSVQDFTVPYSVSLKGTCQHHKMFLFNIYAQSPTGRLAYQKQAEGIK